ncbi:MAG: hypothetical protein DME26_16095 [Verrucomicrobia bacterium]|nr:MAG: hypothetical protein DME26_16095 [Verrucomicrobiota bacterium]
MWMPMNRNVGWASRLPPSSEPPKQSLARARKLGRRDACPTLVATRFKGARRAKDLCNSLLDPLPTPSSRREEEENMLAKIFAARDDLDRYL